MSSSRKLWLTQWVCGFTLLLQTPFNTTAGLNIELAVAIDEQAGSLSLDLDQPGGEGETVQVLGPSKAAALASFWLVLSFLAYLFILTLIFLYVRMNQDIVPHFSFRLQALPASAKVLVTIVLFMFSLVHGLGLWNAYLQTHEVFESAEEYFGYMKLTRLISLSHPHLFGFALMYFFVGSLFILTPWSEAIKSVILVIPILSALFDVFSWWMIKMVSADFELLSLFTGITFAIGFGVMTLIILKEMWLTRNPYKVNQPVSQRKESHDIL